MPGKDAAYRGGATVAPPFLAGAMPGKDAAYRGGATVAPPFLAGAMPGDTRRLESRRRTGRSVKTEALPHNHPRS